MYPIEQTSLGSSGMASYIPGTSGLVPVALNATAGFLVGKLLGYPLAGAAATGAFGMLGLLGVAIYAAYNDGGR